MPGEASFSPVLPNPPVSLAVWQPTGCSVRNLKNPNRQNANPTRRDCPEPRLPAVGEKPPCVAAGEKRDRSALVGSACSQGTRSSPWTSRGSGPARGNSVPQIPSEPGLGFEGERPGTQGPGVGGLWVPVPARLCPQPSPLRPRRLAVSGAGVPGVICAPAGPGPSLPGLPRRSRLIGRRAGEG